MSTDPISKYLSNGINYCTYMKDTYPFIDPSKTDLTGRNVLITGASKGIGYDMALSFARAGASGIAVSARSSLDKLVQAIPEAAKSAGKPIPKIVALKMDVSSREDVEAGGPIVQRELGHLDVLVMNAGVLEPIVKLLDQDVDTWWKTWEINMLGVFLTLRVFLPMVLSHDSGLKTVVGLSSIGAAMNSPGLTAYQPGKLALSRLMGHIMAEYGEQGLLAYSVHPGAVLTEMTRSAPEPLRSSCQDHPRLTGDTVVWLTKEKRDWLAGRYISCNWNMEEFLLKRPEIEKRDLLKFRLAMGGEDWSKA